MRSDHPSNKKDSGVFIYYHNLLSLSISDIFFLIGGITFELKQDDKLHIFVALYRSPSQCNYDFAIISDTFELTPYSLFKKSILFRSSR